jgi:hypothetical protein
VRWITTRSRLTAVSGRRLLYSIEVFDKVEKVGKATDRRSIVDSERFDAPGSGKASQSDWPATLTISAGKNGPGRTYARPRRRAALRPRMLALSSSDRNSK